MPTTEVEVKGKVLYVHYEVEYDEHTGDNIPFGSHKESWINVLAVTDADGNKVSPEFYELAINKI